MTHKQIFNMEIEIEVRDKDGKLLVQRKFQAHSWVLNFIRAIRGLMYSVANSGVETLTDTDGNTRAFPNLYQENSAIFKIVAGAGDSSFGILVGTSDTPVSPTDYKLGDQILHGSDTGQMLYGDTFLEEVNSSDSTYYFRIIRTFTNNSGSSITVKEVGLAFRHKHADGSLRHYLIARDILPTPTTVPDGASLTVRYIISVALG